MSNIVKLHPNTDIPQGLRNIADSIEMDDVGAEGCTVVIGLNVYHLGTHNDTQAASDAVFNMTYGIHRLMSPIIDHAKIDD